MADKENKSFKFLRLPQVCEKVGLSKATIYRLMKDDVFPPSVKIGQRAVGWSEKKLQEWADSRIEA